MKLTRSLWSIGVFVTAALWAKAQAPKIAVIDLAKVFSAHYATIAEAAKLKASTDKAQQELDQMSKERDALVSKYQASLEQANNPLTTGDAKTQAQAATQKIAQEAQAKINEMQKFANDVRSALQQQSQNFRGPVVDEISKLATRIAKANGATLLLDESALSGLGSPILLYSDSSSDITAEVQAEIAKTKPANLPAGQASPSSAPIASSSTGSANPTITVPNVIPAK